MTDQMGGMPQQPIQPALDQAPPPPTEPPIARGSQVAVVVSQGPSTTPQGAPIPAPDVVGTQQGAAVAKLQALGISVQALSDYSPVAAQGSVTAQYPEPGQRVVAGSTAVLIVSKGVAAEAVAMVGLPDVVGLLESEAVSKLEAAGISPHVAREFSATVPEGVVMAQVPNALSLARTPSKGMPVWAWVAAAAVVVLLLGGVWMMRQNQQSGLTVAKVALVTTSTTEASSTVETTAPATTTPPPATTAPVPSVVGKSQADAESALKSAGFVPVVTKLTTDKSPAGQVVAQLPAGGSELQTGAQVAIEVVQAPAPSAPTTAKVPNVVGMTQSNAQGAISEVGLVSSFVTIANSAPKGTAVAQEPGSGVSVALGTVVIVELSSGTPPPPSTVAVPDVVGMTQSAAQSALSSAKLSSQVVDEFSATAPKGTVADQSPLAGSKVAPGTTVAIVVSLGPKPTTPTQVTVPDLKGKTAEAANQALADLELLAEEVSVPSSSAPAGQVVGQMPAAGTHVPQASTVVIDVSEGAPTVTPY